MRALGRRVRLMVGEEKVTPHDVALSRLALQVVPRCQRLRPRYCHRDDVLMPHTRKTVAKVLRLLWWMVIPMYGVGIAATLLTPIMLLPISVALLTPLVIATVIVVYPHSPRHSMRMLIALSTYSLMAWAVLTQEAGVRGGIGQAILLVGYVVALAFPVVLAVLMQKMLGKFPDA